MGKAKDCPPVKQLSFTRINKWEKCPYQYFKSYIQKPPQPPEFNKYFAFGNLLHKVFERVTKRLIAKKEGDELLAAFGAGQELNIVLQRSALTDAFEAEFLELWKTMGKGLDRDEYFPKASDGFRFVADDPVRYLRGIAAEERFKIKIPGCVLPITGFIDRVDRDGDTIEVVDYKSGKAKLAKFLRHELQAPLYVRVVHLKYGVPLSDIKASYEYPVFAKRVILSFSEMELEVMMDRVRAADKGIRELHQLWGDEGVIPEPRVHRLCDWCDFKPICPAFRDYIPA